MAKGEQKGRYEPVAAAGGGAVQGERCLGGPLGSTLQPDGRPSEAAIRRFLKRHAITFKKNAARGRTGSARRVPGSRTLEG
jgi:hypothetical protein